MKHDQRQHTTTAAAYFCIMSCRRSEPEQPQQILQSNAKQSKATQQD